MLQGIIPALDALIGPVLHSQQSLLACVLINLVADLVDAHISYLEVCLHRLFLGPAGIIPAWQCMSLLLSVVISAELVVSCMSEQLTCPLPVVCLLMYLRCAGTGCDCTLQMGSSFATYLCIRIPAWCSRSSCFLAGKHLLTAYLYSV